MIRRRNASLLENILREYLVHTFTECHHVRLRVMFFFYARLYAGAVRLLLLNVQAQFVELFPRQRRRGVYHHVPSGIILGERNEIADNLVTP